MSTTSPAATTEQSRRKTWGGFAERVLSRPRPRSDTADPLRGNARHESLGRIGHRWKLDVGTEIDVCEPLEQLGRASLGHARTAVQNEVLLQARRVDAC